jgi:hypothetical protein
LAVAHAHTFSRIGRLESITALDGSGEFRAKCVVLAEFSLHSLTGLVVESLFRFIDEKKECHVWWLLQERRSSFR